MSHRVVITGIGAVTPCGIGKEPLWERVRNGNSCVEQVTRLDPSGLPVTMAAEVRDFVPEDFFDRRKARRMERSTQFAVAASELAWNDARLEANLSGTDRIGVFEGTALGPMNSIFESHRNFIADGCRRVNPTMLTSSMFGSGSGSIAQKFQIHGPCMTISDGSASSTFAIGTGFRNIRQGLLDVALAGGSEAPISREICATFSCARLLATHNQEPHRAMKPFDRNRDGFILGEGGVYLVLEESGHALRRGAHIYAEISGFGETTDAYHPTSPHPEGYFMGWAMTNALREANLSPGDIQYVHAHGTATKLNDVAETKGVKHCFGEFAPALRLSSTKPVTGHLLGACGALEAAITLLALENQYLPPTINLASGDPECDLDYVPNEGRRAGIEHAMINNFSFSGRNASLVFQRFNSNNQGGFHV
jgi:3-oxoacyl-[acyl-carrier-protein] synthase II